MEAPGPHRRWLFWAAAAWVGLVLAAGPLTGIEPLDLVTTREWVDAIGPEWDPLRTFRALVLHPRFTPWDPLEIHLQPLAMLDRLGVPLTALFAGVAAVLPPALAAAHPLAVELTWGGVIGLFLYAWWKSPGERHRPDRPGRSGPPRRSGRWPGRYVGRWSALAISLATLLAALTVTAVVLDNAEHERLRREVRESRLRQLEAAVAGLPAALTEAAGLLEDAVNQTGGVPAKAGRVDWPAVAARTGAGLPAFPDPSDGFIYDASPRLPAEPGGWPPLAGGWPFQMVLDQARAGWPGPGGPDLVYLEYVDSRGSYVILVVPLTGEAREAAGGNGFIVDAAGYRRLPLDEVGDRLETLISEMEG